MLTFTIYDGKTDPVEHVSYYNQSMAIYSKNEALMCKIFPSSLGLSYEMVWWAGKKGAIRGYDELYEGLGLIPKDLTEYNNPLLAFDGSIVLLVGQVTLLMEVEGKKEMVHFIVVHSYSPYIAILGRPWIRSMSAVPSSLQ